MKSNLVPIHWTLYLSRKPPKCRKIKIGYFFFRPFTTEIPSIPRISFLRLCNILLGVQRNSFRAGWDSLNWLSLKVKTSTFSSGGFLNLNDWIIVGPRLQQRLYRLSTRNFFLSYQVFIRYYKKARHGQWPNPETIGLCQKKCSRSFTDRLDFPDKLSHSPITVK